MKNKLKFFKRNKQGIIALLVLFIMLFNACDISSSNTDTFTPKYFYVDSSGKYTETDSGRTVLVLDKKSEVVFFSDNIASSAQRVVFAFKDKTIIFVFEKNQNFPTGIVLSDSKETYKGVFTLYDSVSQNYSLTLEHDGDKEILSNIALNKDIFTQYKDDPSLTSSQNLRMRNLYIAMCIFTSLNDFLSSDAHQARNIFTDIASGFKKTFIDPVIIIIDYGKKIVSDPLVQFGKLIWDLSKDTLEELDPMTIVWSIINEIIKQVGIPFGNQVVNASGGGGGGGGSGGVGNTPTTVAVTGVSLNKTSVSLIVGNVETLVPTITPTNATNKAVSWSSSNPAVAKVSSYGTVTSLSIGTATITVTTSDGSKTASCIINVNPVPVTSVSLNKATTAMVVNGTETLFAEVKPSNAGNKNVSWSSNNAAVATVSSNGMVTGVSVGTATITVVTVDGNKTAVCNVTVVTSAVAVTEVSLNKSSTSLDVGGTETLVATISPSSATDQNVTWYSNNTSVATVSANGTVTALTAGTATITVETADVGKTASCVVTVISWDVYNETTWNEVVNRIKNGGNNKTYTVTVTENFSMPGVTTNIFGSVTGVTVTITGDKEISLATGSSGSLLRIGENQTVIIRDLVLRGHNTNNASLVYINGANSSFTMQRNATVSGNNTSSLCGGGVFVGYKGVFTMQDNATVSGNTAGEGGGVYVNGDNFVMRDNATVSSNTARSDGGGVYVISSGYSFSLQGNATVSGNTVDSSGGGVYVASGVFTIHDNATVSGNSASLWRGGGVYLGSTSSGSGVLKMIGGTVYGNVDGPVGNTSKYEGAALYIYVNDGSGYGSDGSAIYYDGSDILPHTDGKANYTNNTITGM